MREFWLIDDAPIFGGAERIVLRLARHIDRSMPNAGVRVVTPATSELAARCVDADLVVEDATFPGRSALEVPRIIPAVARLRGILSEAGDESIVVGASLRSLTYTHAALMRRARPPALVHFMPEQESARRLTTRLLLRRAVVVLGENAAQSYRGRLPGVPVTAVNNFLLPEEFEAAKTIPDPLRETPPALGVLARLIPAKGVLDLIEELASIPSSWSRLIVGGERQDRDYANTIERRLAERGLTGRVRLLGRVEDLAPFLGEVDVLVVPSVGSEGQPTVIIEALAHGRPVLVRAPVWSSDFDDVPVLPYRSADDLGDLLGAISACVVNRQAVASAFGVMQVIQAFEGAVRPPSSV